MYDLHILKDSDPVAPKPDDLIAGGASRNNDNSVEKNAVEVDGTACIANVVIDDLPAQLSLVSAGGSLWNCNDVNPLQCNWEGSGLGVGEELPAVTVTVRVNDNATGTNIHNVAIASALVDDVATPPTLDEAAFGGIGTIVTAQDDEDTPLPAMTDLAIVTTASAVQVGAGNTFNWVLTVTNNGPGTAQNVAISDIVPAGVTVTGVSCYRLSSAIARVARAMSENLVVNGEHPSRITSGSRKSASTWCSASSRAVSRRASGWLMHRWPPRR